MKRKENKKRTTVKASKPQANVRADNSTDAEASNMPKKGQEQVKGKKNSKSKEKEDNKINPKKESAERTEKSTDNSEVLAAVVHLCDYLLNMKDLSLSTYFDKNLANYTNPNAEQKSTSAWEKNMSKNRSKEQKLLDHSRVKLPTSKEEPNDYINASKVSFENLETEFILTQYPLPDTTLDLWKMIANEQSDRIISIFEPYMDDAIEEFHKVPDTPSPLTSASPGTTTTSTDSPGTPQSMVRSIKQQNIENHSCRCELGVTKSYFPLFTDNYFNISEWLINTKKVETDKINKTWMATYTVELVPQLCSNSLIVRVFNCSTWPFKKVPGDERKMLSLATTPWLDLQPTYEAQKEGGVKRVRPKPVVVMCDLGLDRSATVVFTAALIEYIFEGKKVDCDKLFREFRNQRAGVFTSSMFYTYAIRSVLIYCRLRLKNEKDDSWRLPLETALLKVPFTSAK